MERSENWSLIINIGMYVSFDGKTLIETSSILFLDILIAAH